MKPIIEKKSLIPDHQFGFRNNHATVEQVHRMVNLINAGLEEKKYCSAAFLDVSQAFDKVWHQGLRYKLKKLLPAHFYNILESYLHNRFFYVDFKGEETTLRSVLSGVPQGSVLGPLLYLIYTADLPTSNHTSLYTFAHDTAIIAVHEDPAVASSHLQNHLNKVGDWLKEWKIKANATKSQHITFTLRRNDCPAVTLDEVEVPRSDSVKYLGRRYLTLTEG
ncbi:hypothetical protein DMENIID0001_003960 [Sergentomyia squamirostris]